MRRYWFPKQYADAMAKWRVPSGFLLAGAFAIFSRPSIHSLAIGVPVSLVGLSIRTWAAGHLSKNRSLATSGPYSYVRNPLYLGTLLTAAGLVVSSQRWELAVLFALAFGFVYLPVIEQEEQHLRNLFPEYAQYAERAPLLLPRGPRMKSTEPFRPALYLRNQEYQALAAYIAGLALLIWKASA